MGSRTFFTKLSGRNTARLTLAYDFGGRRTGGLSLERRRLTLASAFVVVVALATTSGAQAATPQQAAGRHVFQTAGCSACHTLRAAGARGLVGPNLDLIASYARDADEGLKQFLVAAITNPPAPYVPAGYAAVMPTTFSRTLRAQQISDVVAFLEAPAGASSAASAGRSAASPTYLTTGGIEEVIEQDGLRTANGVHHATLYVGCSGQGFPGARMVDPKYGVPEPSYDQFLCAISLSGSPINLIHVQMTHDGYSWQSIG